MLFYDSNQGSKQTCEYYHSQQWSKMKNLFSDGTYVCRYSSLEKPSTLCKYLYGVGL